MVRLARAAAFVAVCLASAALVAAAPIRLARHPDYHAGKIAFSYLGDIWTANEDGTASQRLTDNRAREIYPRFSPDGRWIAFSSNRYGNNDVFVVAADRRRAAAADVSTPATTRSSGWTRDSQQRASSAPRTATARSRTSRRSTRSRSAAAGEAAAGRLGLLGQLLARRQVAGLQPPSGGLVAPALSRQLRRRSVDRRPRRARPTRSCSATSATTATGRCGAPTTRSTSSPIRCRTTRA